MSDSHADRMVYEGLTERMAFFMIYGPPKYPGTGKMMYQAIERFAHQEVERAGATHQEALRAHQDVIHSLVQVVAQMAPLLRSMDEGDDVAEALAALERDARVAMWEARQIVALHDADKPTTH